MALLLTLLIAGVVYVLAAIYAPFPYWRTYFILWRAVLFHQEPAICLRARAKQALLLVKYAVFLPIWALLWALDEIFYRRYKRATVRPVFIVGQPRSGTTFLHRTLAADGDHFIAIRHLEWRYPFICLHRFLARTGLERRLARRSYWSGTEAGAVAARMHPNRLSDWEEDGIFFEECFLHHFFVFLWFPYPHLLQHLDGFPGLPEKVQERILRTHGRVIQKVIYMRGGQNQFYLSKEVTSHNKFPRLLELYPQARFIFCLRPASEFMSSLLALVRCSTKSKIGVDPMRIPRWEPVILDRMQQDGLNLLALCQQRVEPARQTRILFHRLVSYPQWVMEELYEAWGLNMSSAYRQYLCDLQSRQEQRERGYEYEGNVYQGFADFDRFVRAVAALDPRIAPDDR